MVCLNDSKCIDRTNIVDEEVAVHAALLGSNCLLVTLCDVFPMNGHGKSPTIEVWGNSIAMFDHRKVNYTNHYNLCSLSLYVTSIHSPFFATSHLLVQNYFFPRKSIPASLCGLVQNLKTLCNPPACRRV